MNDDAIAALLGEPATDPLGIACMRADVLRRLFGREDAVRLGRFRIVRRIGSGTMGIVYEAVDEEAGQTLALKTMASDDPELALRLKAEFRSVAEVAHPNLVELFELLEIEGRLMFTMELVDGICIDRALASTTDAAMVRDAFGQLAGAIGYVHAAGHVHRDVKATNVLMEPGGRVVLLDFGLVGALDPVGFDRHDIAGTPQYMAPEQLLGAVPDAAADWYSFGALLHEVLTGDPPFAQRELAELLRAKRARALVAPSSRFEDAGDLVALALALLDPDPARRPHEPAILAALGRASRRTSSARALVGRDDALARLQSALERTGTASRVVRIVGDSGIGKSVLLRRFGELARSRGEVVLAGRCHEHDGLPYRGLDGVVDELARILPERLEMRSLDSSALHEVIQLFPALRRAVRGRKSASISTATDPLERRRTAIGMLRVLLRFAGPRVVILVDDWQWTDADSLELFAGLVAPPDPPSVLWVFAGRGLSDAIDPNVDAEILELGPLTERDAVALLQGWRPDAARTRIAEIVRESNGVPLFLVELALAEDSGGPRSMAELVRTRVADLDEATRTCLRLVALAGVPLSAVDAFDLASVSAERRHGTLARLRHARLLAPRSLRDGRIEPYHDRVRELALEGCEPDAIRDLHGRLAVRLGATDPGTAAHHAWAAGDRVRAGDLAELAAERASISLAFERVVEMLELVLLWREPQADAKRALLVRLGNARVLAGHGPAAADAFLGASVGAPAMQRLELRRRAAEELLRSGHVERGRDLLEDVLARHGLGIPFSALLSVAIERTRLRIRGLGLGTMTDATARARTLAVSDACWTAATGFGFVDLAMSAAFFARGTRLALDTGDLERSAKWLALHALQLALAGRPARRRASKALMRAMEVADAGNDHVAAALVRMAAGAAHHAAGQWRATVQACDEAVHGLRRLAKNVWWELTSAGILAESAIYWLGDLDELESRVEREVGEATARGDLFGVVTRRAGGLSAVNRLRVDDPDLARRESAEAMAKWPRAGTHVQHWYALQAEVQIALYEGSGFALVEHVERIWPALERSQLHRAQMVRVTSHWRRAIAAVAAMHERPECASIVRRSIRRLASERLPWADALAETLRASMAVADGQRGEAMQRLRTAAASFEVLQMKVLATVTRRRLGELMGGFDGKALVSYADANLQRRGVVRPERFARIFVPMPW